MPAEALQQRRDGGGDGGGGGGGGGGGAEGAVEIAQNYVVRKIMFR